MNEVVKNISSFSFFLLFLYSGLESFSRLGEKAKRLNQKILFNQFDVDILRYFIGLVNLLLIICSIVAMILTFQKTLIPDLLIYFSLVYFSLFMVSVSFIYYFNQPIKFLTNVSLFAGIIYIYVTSFLPKS